MYFLFSPNGRFRRWQYWTIKFFIWATSVTTYVMIRNAIDPHDPPFRETIIFTGFLIVLGAALLVWCNICATIKRYHDRGMSGWWWLIILVPVIGGLWQLIECGFLAGDDDDNEYGPGPAFGSGGVEEEIRQLKASQGFGISKPEKSNSTGNRKNAFPPPPKPLFGQGSRP